MKLLSLVFSMSAFASGSASPQRQVVDVGWIYEYSSYLESILTPEIKRASISSLCPGVRDREAVTLAIFKAMAKAESGYNRKLRFVEQGLGRDAVTGRQNTSEGLFQVSYQDSRYHGCRFDWSVDRRLSDTNGAKTIFDPYRNIHCAVTIMTKLLRQGGTFQQAGAKYWSVLRPSRAGYRSFKSALVAQRGECR